MNADKIVNWPAPKGLDMEYGTVRGVGENSYVIHGPSGVKLALVAFSCLVKPMPGDKVMYTHESSGGCYILSILERQNHPDAVLSFPGDVLLESTNGRVVLAARSGIDMATSSSLNMLATDVNVSANTGQINVQDLQATGESFTGTINNTRIFSNLMEVVAKHVIQRAKTSFRFVDEIEQVTAGQLINKVRNLFSVRSRQSAITAIGDVKVDGKRVHIG